MTDQDPWELIRELDWHWHIDNLEFAECDACRAKPGSPTLCTACLVNRSIINSLKKRKRVKEMTISKNLEASSKITSVKPTPENLEKMFDHDHPSVLPEKDLTTVYGVTTPDQDLALNSGLCAPSTMTEQPLSKPPEWFKHALTHLELLPSKVDSHIQLDHYAAWVAARSRKADIGAERERAVVTLGLAGEAAEVARECLNLTIAAGNACDIVKKEVRGSKNVDVGQLTKELGDLLYYTCAVANIYAINVNDILDANVSKLTLSNHPMSDKNL